MIIYIDGKECVCERGEYLMEVAGRNNIFIPRLCHHDGLPGQSCCRVCVVEVENGSDRWIVTSCAYPAEPGLRVYTNSEKVKKQRGMTLSLLNAGAPAGDRVAAMRKFLRGELPARFITRKDEKCVLCGLCVRACESVGAGAIATVGRGTGKKVSTPYDDPSDACVGCGSCANVCPTKAISMEEDSGARKIWGKIFTLAKCESCDAIIGTPEEIALAAKRAGVAPVKLCNSCRQKSLAGALAKIFGES